MLVLDIPRFVSFGFDMTFKIYLIKECESIGNTYINIFL